MMKPNRPLILLTLVLAFLLAGCAPWDIFDGDSEEGEPGNGELGEGPEPANGEPVEPEVLSPVPGSRLARLQAVKTWMYQIQEVAEESAVEALAKSRYDLIVIEPTNTNRHDADFDSAAAVRRIKAGRPGRIVLAYIDIGEAESYRTYWQKDWRPPKGGKRGSPDFIVTADPDGWADNYPVAYWDQRWHAVVLDLVASALDDGYDGIYMDWVEAYDDDDVIAAAEKANVDPARAMVNFIFYLRNTAQRTDPEFLIVAQNAPYLLDLDDRYANAIDAVAFEDTWFRGEADADWDDAEGGDLPNKYPDEYATSSLIRQYRKYRKHGLPVFTCDYCLKPANAKKVYAASRAQGFIALVTRVSLAAMTETPPPGY